MWWLSPLDAFPDPSPENIVAAACRLSEDPSPAQLRQRASGAAIAIFCTRRDARVKVQTIQKSPQIRFKLSFYTCLA
jgi:hypothetical protein